MFGNGFIKGLMGIYTCHIYSLLSSDIREYVGPHAPAVVLWGLRRQLREHR